MPLLTTAHSPVGNFLVLLLSATLLICTGGYFLATSEISATLAALERTESGAVHLAGNGLVERVRGSIHDLAYITAMPLLRNAVATPTKANLARLAEDLIAYADANSSIDQIRWIDMHGNERIRINQVRGRAVRVPDSQLQNKSSRPYVTETLRLPRGEIYLSPLDLNIEHGKIEIPYKPMVRVAAPLWRQDGPSQSTRKRDGLVVINYRAQTWIDAAVKSAGIPNGDFMLLNTKGYWLFGPSQVDDWGFMLGRPTATLAHKARAVWDVITHESEGSDISADGLWTWRNVYPLTLMDTESQRGRPAARSVGLGPYVWRIVTHMSAQDIAKLRWRTWRLMLSAMGILILSAAAIAAWVVRAQIQIARLNVTLQERAEAAEAATKAKANFLANMSHEIRTPMNAVLGLAYLLDRTQLSDEARDLVGKMRNAGRSLQGVINDILDYSKIESGHLEVERTAFSLRETLDHLTSIIGGNVRGKDIELIIRPPADGVDRLRGDALRLEQVLINLTSNAIKFTEHGYVEVAIDTAAADGEKVVLRFAVRDTGIGIAEEKQKELFRPFTQADTSTTRLFGGTGLGLAISQQLVNLMGGEIELVSTPGQGSEFSFSLPFDRDAQPTISRPEAADLHLLIADDNAVAREALRVTAGGLGWTSDVVASGSEAVEQALANDGEAIRNDVIILDWKMPGMNGLAAARAIHEASKGKPEPIILMVTADSREALLDEPDAALADAVLSKPVSPSSLYDAVAKALKLHQGETATWHSHDGNRLHGVRLLIVDDSDINRDVAQRIFSGEGAEVSLANDGKQALEWLRSHEAQVDIVLMDVQMPVMDGYEATRAIRAIPAYARLPIVALTAGAFQTQKDAAQAAGMDDYIAKPIDVDAAITLIQRLASGAAPGTNFTAAEPAPIKQAASHLEDLAVGRGLLRWKDATVYRQYLRKFAQDYGDCVRTIEHAGHVEGASIAHKLKGVAGNLALESLAAAVGALERRLKTNVDATAELAALQTALNGAIAAIDRYAPMQPKSESQNTESEVPGEIATLLRSVLQALDADDPGVVEPLLLKLDSLLPAAQLTPIRTAVEDFDFRGGEAAASALAQRLGIDLKETN